MASQVSVAWTLEGLKTVDEKFHLTDTPAAAASPAGAVTAGLEAHAASAQVLGGPSSGVGSAPRAPASANAKLAGSSRRKLNLPFSSATEVRELKGQVDKEEMQALRRRSFARYMQAVHARTGESDPKHVLRRLHHWVRTQVWPLPFCRDM